MNISQSLTHIYKGLQVKNITRVFYYHSRTKYELILRVTRTDDIQNTSWAVEHFYNVYTSYDSILKVKYHILHHYFYPHCQSDFSECLQITKCIKSSAAHQEIFIYDVKSDIFLLFLSSVICSINHVQASTKNLSLLTSSSQSKAFFKNYCCLFHTTSLSCSNHFKPFSEPSIYLTLTSALDPSSYDNPNISATSIYTLNF